jgi:dTMP kinase
VEVAMTRAKARGNTADRFEKEESDFYRRVRDVYLARAQAPNYITVDASKPLGVVRQTLKRAIDNLTT